MIRKLEIIEQAKLEIAEESIRSAIDSMKVKLKSKKWWHKLLPFKIVIIKRN